MIDDAKRRLECEMGWLGIDLGSVSLKLAVVDSRGEVRFERYVRFHGQPYATAWRELMRLQDDLGRQGLSGVGVTGSGGPFLSELLGAPAVNEIIALARGCAHLVPSARALIDIGGEDSKLILFQGEPASSSPAISDFAMNSICAAGTGSFLDQQASRLGMKVEELGPLSLRSLHPPRVAGRCSVFAKTDMIHLQQEGARECDIVAGLCFAMARNFRSTVARGKSFLPPVVFVGGVAANQGMVRALRETLELSDRDFLVPEHFTSFGAVGAALTAQDENGHGFILDLTRLRDYLARPAVGGSSLAPLRLSARDRDADPSPRPSTSLPSTEFTLSAVEVLRVFDMACPTSLGRTSSDFRPRGVNQGAAGLPAPAGAGLPVGLHRDPAPAPPPVTEVTVGYLGVDVGSISTKGAVISPEGTLLAAAYLRTSGRPLEAVKEVMERIREQLPSRFEILGAGTTGSGRYLVGDFIGADVVKNEISAQARASAFIDPAVDTIFEIGGQDSKYIRLQEGAVVDFEMNKVCAAGTGSFLEEQAEKLGIRIEEEFGTAALGAPSPVSLGERCTVFMESDLLHHQRAGSARDDLVAGLCYSIALNYLNRVVVGKKIGERLFFQGAVAFNAGVVAAFEKILGKRIVVPPHPHVTGAIGAALWAKEGREKARWRTSRFVGLASAASRRFQQDSFECRACPNRCAINRVTVEGGTPLCYGGWCEKHEVKTREPEKDLPDLFAERERIARDAVPLLREEPAGKRIGLPRALLFSELLPLFQAFFQELGYRVVISDVTKPEIIREGLESVVSETCFPVKVAHGHVLNLLKKGVDVLFLPFLINLEKEASGWKESFNCPYVQSFPSLVRAALDLDRKGVEVVSPVLAFGWREDFPLRSLLRVGELLGRKRREVKRAAQTALRARARYRSLLEERGKEILRGLAPDQKAVVVVGRAYNCYDPGLNLGLPRALRRLGIFAIPLDFLPLDGLDISGTWPNMYWRSGQKILQAAHFVRRDPRLYCLYLSNFGCGPDSFIQHFFNREMAGKPFLQVEVDEHSADVGVITRCEAFWDSVHHARVEAAAGEKAVRRPRPPGPAQMMYIPDMGDASLVIAAAFRAAGIQGQVFPPSNQETLHWGRKFTSGKECYPCIVTAGDMIRIVRSPEFQPDRAAFFMPSTDGPCRFGQYCHFHRMILDELGYPDVPVLSPVQSADFYRELGFLSPGLLRRAWRGLVAIDLLERLRRERRPYETVKGGTEQAYRRAVDAVCRAIEAGRNVERAFAAGLKGFDRQALDFSVSRPLIGIVGEIFVRNHPFSNDRIVEQVEELGGEVALPPVREWLWHLNQELKFFGRVMGKWVTFSKALMVGLVQHRDERRLLSLARPYLRRGTEPEIEEIWKNAEPYLPPWFGEAALSAGKSVEYARARAGGIINVMPFTCIPGTIFATVLHRLRRDFSGIPSLTLAFDGLQQSNSRTRLEAFMSQARQRHRRGL